MREWSTKTENAEFHIPAVPYGNRNIMVENSQEHSSSSSLALPLPTLDLQESENFSENREESQIVEPLCTSGTALENAPDAPIAPGTHKSTRENFGKPAKKYIVTSFTCKDTIAPGTVIFQWEMLNLELYTYLDVL